MRPAFLLVALLGCASCGSSTMPSGPLDRQVVLAVGQTASVSEAGVSLRFDGVQGDSRCPLDANCVQGGDAIVRVVVDAVGGRATIDLHTGDGRPVVHQRLTIALLELSPYPFGAQPIRPGDYRVTLRISE